MGTILIGLKRDRAEVKQCHVNVWTLPGWPGELHFLDIGIWIANTSEELIEHFDLGIPARLEECEATCLVSRVSDRKIWQLVFPDCTGIIDQPEGHWHRTLMRPDSPLRMTNVTIQPIQEYARDFSLWRILLRKALPPSKEAYIRVRFKIKSVFGGAFGAIQVSRDLVFYESVRTYDIRINEMREQADLDPILELFENLSPIGRINAFLIVRPGYTPRVVSRTRHIRLLEGKRWEAYLDRRLSVVGGPPKLVIYSWRSPWEEPSVEEFRAFASFHRDLGRLHAPTVSIGIVLSLLAVAVAQPDWVKDRAESISDFAQENPLIAAAVVVVPLLLYFFARFVKRFAETIDALLYGTRLGS